MTLPLRNLVLVVVVATLAVTAGCNSVGSGQATETPAANATPTATDTATPTDGPETPESALNGSELHDETASAVEDAGSYTSTVDAVVVVNATSGESEITTNTTTQVDFDAGVGLRERAQTTASSTLDQTIRTDVYTDGNTSYRRQNSSRGVTYDNQTGTPEGLGSFRPVNVTSYDQSTYALANLTDAFVWEENGTETVDGTTTTRYTITGVANAAPIVGQSEANITASSGSVYVDSDGAVRRVTLAYTLENEQAQATSTTELTFTLTDFGSTTVEEPDWLDQAR